MGRVQAAAVVLLATAPAVARAAPVGQGACQFVLGFATVRAQLPAQVGQCLEYQQTNVANGDAYQRTTGGLLVWRKADSLTAFTNGHETWIIGPIGLVRRLNTQRFPWEADNGSPGTTTIQLAPPAPRPAPAPAAHQPPRPVTSEPVLGLCLRQQDGYFLPDQPPPGSYGTIKTGIVVVNHCAFPITFISSAKLVRPGTGYVLQESDAIDKERVTLGPNEVRRVLHFVSGVFAPPYEIKGYHAVAY